MARNPKIKVLFIAAVNEAAPKPHMPGFVALLIKVTQDEYVRGYQFDYAEEWLKDKGCGEPYVLFTEEECPLWLLAAFRRGEIEGCTPVACRRAVVQRERVFAKEISQAEPLAAFKGLLAEE